MSDLLRAERKGNIVTWVLKGHEDFELGVGGVLLGGLHRRGDIVVVLCLGLVYPRLLRADVPFRLAMPQQNSHRRKGLAG